MNIIDIIVILLIIMFGIWGMKRGAIRSFVSLVGIILVFILAYLLKNPLAEWMSLNLPFFSFTGSFKGATILNVIIYQVIAFLVVFFILLTIYEIAMHISGLIEKIIKLTIILSIPTKIVGFIIGLIEGVLVSLLGIMILSLPTLKFDLINESNIRNYLYSHSPIIGNITKNTNSSIEEIMELTDKFSDEENRDEFNLECFDILLKHKVIGIDYSERLVASGKLKIDENKEKEIINKYKD